MKKKFKKRYTQKLAVLLAAFILSNLTCGKYLDEKPDKKQAVPSTLQDLQAMLDNVTVMNRGYPNYGEAAADNYYLTGDGFNALPTNEDKALYTWKRDGIVIGSQWLSPYKIVYYANQVLESLAASPEAHTTGGAQIKGAALFFRGYAFLQVAGIFAPQYDAATAASDPGIPLRLTADFNPKSVRASNEETYRQIITDLKQAAQLLPKVSEFPTRPTSTAAWAALSRVLLTMGNYQEAGRYADSCLSAGAMLMDLNTISQAAPNPFKRFNSETLFYAISTGGNGIHPATGRIDSLLYRSYSANDLRKTIYFKTNTDGSHAFKGNYDGVQSALIFSGPATDEMYLVSAECSARSGQAEKAMSRLNQLLATRFKAGTFVPLEAADSDTALDMILNERRKELVYRGLRWFDLKRLNKEDRFQTTLQRKIDGTVYQLGPGDLRYQFLIPQSVISASGMAQNPR